MISENLINDQLNVQSIIETGGISDHRLICLKIKVPKKNPPTPFNINPLWFSEEDYKTLILEAWQPLTETSNHSYMQQFHDNMVKMKKYPKIKIKNTNRAIKRNSWG